MKKKGWQRSGEQGGASGTTAAEQEQARCVHQLVSRAAGRGTRQATLPALLYSPVHVRQGSKGAYIVESWNH